MFIEYVNYMFIFIGGRRYCIGIFAVNPQFLHLVSTHRQLFHFLQLLSPYEKNSFSVTFVKMVLQLWYYFVSEFLYYLCTCKLQYCPPSELFHRLLFHLIHLFHVSEPLKMKEIEEGVFFLIFKVKNR